jgi:hypothetical protein
LGGEISLLLQKPNKRISRRLDVDSPAFQDARFRFQQPEPTLNGSQFFVSFSELKKVWRVSHV